MIRKHFRLKKVLLGLAFALVAAPSAQAYTGFTVDGTTPGIQSHTDARHAALMNRHTALAQPLSQLQIQGMRWNAIAAAYQSQSRVRSERSSAPAPSTASGFNWNDAGVGASIAFGVALFLLLSVAFGRRYYMRSGTGLPST
jgi:hypothetical protein